MQTPVEPLIQASSTYGLGIVLSILMALFLFWVLRYVLRENSRREEKLGSIIEGNMKHLMDQMMTLMQQLSAHDTWEREIDTRTTRAHEHQKGEHEEQLRAIQRLSKEA